MKRASLITALVLSMAAAIPATASAAPATGGFNLICRAGGGMAANFHKNGGGMAVTIAFRKGQSANAPAPGECVWVDRPVNGAEPSQLYIRIDDGNFQVICGQNGCHLKSAPGVAAFLVNKIKSGGTFRVTVNNEGNGFFRVANGK